MNTAYLNKNRTQGQGGRLRKLESGHEGRHTSVGVSDGGERGRCKVNISHRTSGASIHIVDGTLRFCRLEQTGPDSPVHNGNNDGQASSGVRHRRGHRDMALGSRVAVGEPITANANKGVTSQRFNSKALDNLERKTYSMTPSELATTLTHAPLASMALRPGVQGPQTGFPESNCLAPTSEQTSRGRRTYDSCSR